jgi:hypothetical protein
MYKIAHNRRLECRYIGRINVRGENHYRTFTAENRNDNDSHGSDHRQRNDSGEWHCPLGK